MFLFEVCALTNAKSNIFRVMLQ